MHPFHLPQLEQIVQEPKEIMDRLQQQWGIQQFILVGICSGAYASFKTSCEDDRVLAAPRATSPVASFKPTMFST